MTHASFGPDLNRGVGPEDLEVADADARTDNGAAEWDEMYASSGQAWSGQPNSVLVARRHTSSRVGHWMSGAARAQTRSG